MAYYSFTSTIERNERTLCFQLKFVESVMLDRALTTIFVENLSCFGDCMIQVLTKFYKMHSDNFIELEDSFHRGPSQLSVLHSHLNIRVSQL